jgi:hypothetical protein
MIGLVLNVESVRNFFKNSVSPHRKRILFHESHYHREWFGRDDLCENAP